MHLRGLLDPTDSEVLHRLKKGLTVWASGAEKLGLGSGYVLIGITTYMYIYIYIVNNNDNSNNNMSLGLYIVYKRQYPSTGFNGYWATGYAQWSHDYHGK